ncbi:MAG: hypothetical protein AB7Q42_10540 [Acidimicrobiia bacterium]
MVGSRLLSLEAPAATTLPDGFSPELLPGSGGQITIGPDGSAVPIEPVEPVDPGVHHYAGEPGRFIDIYSESLPGYVSMTDEPIDVLGTTGQLGGIEDGFRVAFSLPCGPYTVLAYGVSSDDLEEVIAGLVLTG